MLAAIIANNQNVPQPSKLPTVKIDRGGGGQSWPRYEIVDIIAAAATFMEISGEEPAARAARRHRWIGQALPFVKEAREKREAAAFLTGAQVGAAAEREAAMAAAKSEAAIIADELSLEQMIKIVDDVRGVDALAQLPRDRGGTSNGAGALVIGLVVGVALGVALVGKRRRH
jgi:hypothetical protein